MVKKFRRGTVVCQYTYLFNVLKDMINVFTCPGQMRNFSTNCMQS
jgi:hypothetical protein